MISIHFDCFRSLKAPFFSYHGFYLSALKSSKVSFSKQNMVDFYFQNLILVLLKPMAKSQALTCTMQFYDPKQASRTVSSDSDCFRAALNAPFFSYQRLHVFKSNLYIERFFTKCSKKKSKLCFAFRIFLFVVNEFHS